MTQALNLANFANNLNTGGATSNSGLQNSSVTVTAGTGMSGGGAVALGSSVTLTNAGVTSLTAGSGISLSGSTGAVTVTATGSGVTSAVAGNGIAVSGATGAVTFRLGAPSYGSIGSYAIGATTSIGTTASPTIGSSYGNMYSMTMANPNSVGDSSANPLSGTWLCTSNVQNRVLISCSFYGGGLFVRIA